MDAVTYALLAMDHIMGFALAVLVVHIYSICIAFLSTISMQAHLINYYTLPQTTPFFSQATSCAPQPASSKQYPTVLLLLFT